MSNYSFHISGMHCASCVALTESELGELPGVSGVKASLARHSVEVSGDFGDKTREGLAADFTEAVKKHGFIVSVEKQKTGVKWSDFRLAIPIAVGFFALFIALQKLGMVNLIKTGSKVSYGTAVLIGVIASLSSCMAVLGGFLLSMSANYAKSGADLRPQMMFHAGRLVSFFVLGGVIGLAGSVFQFGDHGTFVVDLIVSVVMLILGINLLDIFPWAKKLQPSLPGFLAQHVQGLKKLNHTATPLLAGIATFFLPCGFTQAMQLYSITTGKFFSGAMIMTSFALGTLPVLALLSFGSFGKKGRMPSGVFFKTAGLVVIFFSLFNLLNALVGVGIIPPLFNI